MMTDVNPGTEQANVRTIMTSATKKTNDYGHETVKYQKQAQS